MEIIAGVVVAVGGNQIVVAVGGRVLDGALVNSGGRGVLNGPHAVRNIVIIPVISANMERDMPQVYYGHYTCAINLMLPRLGSDFDLVGG